MTFDRSTGRVLALLASIALLSCAPRPAAPPASPSAEPTPAKPAPAPLPSAEPVFDFQALLDRERPPLELVPVVDPEQHWHASIESRMPPTVRDKGNLVQVRVDVGTKAEIRCEVHDGQVNAGAMVASMLAALSGTIALESVSTYAIDSVRDAPVLLLSALYATRSTPPLGGELKIAVSPRTPYSVVCMQDEPGYRAAFARGVESFLASFETEDTLRSPVYTSIWQVRVGEGLTGYRWSRIYAEPDGSLTSFGFTTFLAQLASGELRIRDSIAVEGHDRSGLSRANFLSYQGTTKVHEIDLVRAAAGKYTYHGEALGKPLDGSFETKTPLGSEYELLLELQGGQGSNAVRAFQLEEYRPDVNRTGGVRVGYSLDPSAQTLSIDAGNQPATWTLKDGLPVGSRVTSGPNVFVGSVLTQKSALGPRSGVTHGLAPQPAAASPWPLAEQRRDFKTQIFGEPRPVKARVPPAKLLSLASYPAPLGQNVAYVSPPRAGAKRPAIIWLGGALDFGIGEAAWARAPRQLDQSARALQQGGLVFMQPALRGSNENPGRPECFFGEVEDVLAAASYLAQRDDVDPARIYLGGHGAGATLGLLVAATTDRFAAVFAFGPVADARQYGVVGAGGCLPEGASEQEVALRAPVRFVSTIRTPTFVFEGGAPDTTNSFDALRENASANVQFEIVPGANHVSVLEPGTRSVARAIADGHVDAAHLIIDARR